MAKEMTGLIESVTGTPVQFYVQHGGEYGRVSWQSYPEDFAACEAYVDKLIHNLDYVKSVLSSGAAGNFMPGSATDSLWRKMG